MFMWKLEDFELLSYSKQLDMLQNILKNEGYKEDIREENKISNHIYTKTGLEYVLSIVRNRKNIDSSKWQHMAVILDLDCYQKYLGGSTARVTLKSRANGLIPIVNNMKERLLIARIHRLVCKVSDPKMQVDHITHNLGIVLREYLRPCSAVENQYNKIFRSTISKSENSFSLMIHPKSKDVLEEYKKKQYQVKCQKNGYTLISPAFFTEKEMYQAIEEVETYFYGEFRYNPMLDMSKTGYAFMLWKMGLISTDQMNEYQKKYILQHQKDIAKYYRLI